VSLRKGYLTRPYAFKAKSKSEGSRNSSGVLNGHVDIVRLLNLLGGHSTILWFPLRLRSCEGAGLRSVRGCTLGLVFEDLGIAALIPQTLVGFLDLNPDLAPVCDGALKGRGARRRSP